MDLYRQNPQFILAEKICFTLQEKGYQALLAGGCVRDFLLNRHPNDFDVATDASPDVIEQSFAKTIAVGKAFGVIVVIEGEEQVEVATFRKDGPYKDGRRPESVEFSEAQEDAKRRDFTVNGLFYDLNTDEVLDYVGGMEDLRQEQLRAIGEPDRRFEEDHLRLLRAVRFAAQLGFEIEAETWNSVCDHKQLIQTVSGERIQDELGKLLMGLHLDRGFELLYHSGLLAQLVDENEFQWKDSFPIFVRKEKTLEDHWFRFFFWLQKMHSQPKPLGYFEALCDKWKFSRDLKQKSLRALQWTQEKELFVHHPLGELLALSYDPEHLRGIIEYSEFFLQDTEKPAFEKFLSRRLELGREKPKPWVAASDLKSALQGEALGKALRLCYWEQLEGNAKAKSDLLKMWGL